MYECDRDFVLTCCCLEPDLSQPPVDFLHSSIQPLVDRFVVLFASDIGTVELLAVKQSNDRVLEFHPGHFASKSHVADREFIFAIDRECVFDSHPSTRAERHFLKAMLLLARARLD